MFIPPLIAAPAPSTWTPSLGAWPDQDGVRFRVWAPDSDRVEVTCERPGTSISQPLDALGDGTFGGCVPGISDGTRYRFRLNSSQLLPDPASRFQPAGVQGPSAVVDARHFPWTDDSWRGCRMS